MSKILSTLAVGSSVYMNVNSVRTEFLIVHQGIPGTMYDASCDGTWLLMKEVYEERSWDSSNNDYENSDIHTYLNGTFLGMFDSDIQSAIKQVKIPYREGTGYVGSNASGSIGLSAKVFLLSGYEVGWTTNTNEFLPVNGACLSYFNGTAATDSKRIGYLNGSAASWWLRSPSTYDDYFAFTVNDEGGDRERNCSSLYGVRPALVLESSIPVSDDGDIIVTPTNSAPSAPGSLNQPGTVVAGGTITVSCGSATDPDGDALTYIFERAYNGGTWAVVQSSVSQTFSETALDGWTAVKYRVKAQDSAGNVSDYTVGTEITVTSPDTPDEPDTPDASDDFLQAIKNKAPQDVRLEFTGGDVIGSSDIAITSGGLTYAEILNGETDVTFGRAVMSELSAVLINADGRFTDFDFSREFTAKIGVKVGDSFEYVNLGVFRGERPDKVRGKLIDFTAHNRMKLFDKSAESFADGLTFPCTLGEIFTKLCSFCGVGYVSAVFPNSNKSFDKNPLADTDYTCREILGYIAEAAGAYARMSRDGAVELVWFAEADYTVTRTDRFEMTESEFLTPPIDKLEVYNSYGDQLNTSGSGDIVYGISDNPFLYIENDTQLAGLQPYVDVIYNRITSLPAYHPSSFRAEFNPAVQCGDIISVVDDYDETIRFPVFVQTITWNGFGKTTYENTGGVIRQNAPFTQRELEQIKKKSLRAVDLYTTIDSYLSTEEGFAAIESAVGGKFVTADDLDEYVKTTELETKITQEVKDGIASLSLSATETTVTSEVPYGSYGTSGGNYGFELTADGYYTSTNKGVHSSYAYCLYQFPASDTAVDVIIRCINYAESTYDYGIISNLNTILAENNSNDGVNVLKSFSGLSSSEPVDVSLTIPASDSTQFITVKYIKDGSQNANNDAFKFRVFKKSSEKSLVSTIKLTQGSAEISSAEITLTGVVTFESLETAGATVINGANITTGKISADRIDTSTLYAKQVLLNTDDGDYPMISSELSLNSAYVKVGVTDDNGWAQFVDIYGTYIRFGRPGYNIANETNGFQIDMTSQRMLPNNKNEWNIGWNTSELYSFWARRHGFYGNTYLRVTSGELRFYYPVGQNADDEFGYEYDYTVLATYNDDYS